MLAYKLLECGHNLVLCIDAKPSSLKANRVLLSHVIRTATVPLGWPSAVTPNLFQISISYYGFRLQFLYSFCFAFHIILYRSDAFCLVLCM